MTDLADRRGLDGEVYQPAEDTHLLATAAVEHVEPDDDVVDVGTGSGFVAASIQSEVGARVVATDLNPHACRQARDRGVETVRADLLDPIAAGSLDVVVCNPPYLPDEPLARTESIGVAESGPSTDDGDGTDWMEVALSGGESGLAVVEPLLADVAGVLRPDGVVLLLVSSITGVDDVVDLAAAEGFSAVAVSEESFPFETLTVLKLVR